MNKKLLANSLFWGFLLWLIGYVLGFIFFFMLPPALMGWVIMPIGIIITLWVLFKKIHANTFNHYAIIAVAWMLIAIVLDYFLLVKALKPADGYYKLDVYIYYALTFILPLLVGWSKTKKKSL